MSIIAALSRKSSPYAGMSLGYGAPFTDAFNKDAAPSAYGLIREYLGTAYACANLNAGLVASTPLRLYVKTRKGDKPSKLSARGDTRALSGKAMRRIRKVLAQQSADATSIEEVTWHPALELLKNPQADTEDGVGLNVYTLFELTALFQEVVGRCYWYIERNGLGGTPSAIWILIPQLVQPIRGGANEPIIKEYQFAGGGNNGRFSTGEIVPWRMPDLFDPYTGGMSPLRSCYEQLRTGRKASALTNATLDNGGKPSAVFAPSASETGGFIGAKEAKRISAAFRQSFGRSGAGGVMVAEVSGQLTPLSWPMNNVIDAAKLGLTKVIICNAFDVPTTKLDRNDANLASAKTGDYAHARDAGIPRLRRNEGALNQFYLPMWGKDAAQRLFFAYDEPEGLTDAAFEFEQSKAAMASGALLRNETRDSLGLEAMPWGNQPTIDSKQIAVDPVTGIPQTPPPPAMPGPQQSEDDQTGKAIAAVLPLLKSLGKRIGEIDKRTRKIVRAKQHAKGCECKHCRPVKRVIKIGETDTGLAGPLPQGERIAGNLAHIFDDMQREVIARLRGHKAMKDATDYNRTPPSILGANPIADEAAAEVLKRDLLLGPEWTERIVNSVQPTVELLAHQAGAKILSHVEATQSAFAVFDRNIPAATQKLAVKLAQSTLDTTNLAVEEAKQAVRDKVEQGLIEGDTADALTEKIQEVFTQAKTERAEMIARTEASRAVHVGQVEGAKASGVVKTKAWLASSDACDICLALVDQGEIPIDQAFDDTDYGPVDGPPEHPNCQCSLTFGLKSEDEME